MSSFFGNKMQEDSELGSAGLLMTLGKLLTISPSSSLCVSGMTVPALRRKEEKVCKEAMNKMQGRDGHPILLFYLLPNGWNTVGLGQEHKSSKLMAQECGKISQACRIACEVGAVVGSSRGLW